MSFKNRTVVVTGAGRGLGAALCRQFGKAGAFIAGCDIDQANLDALSDELTSMNIGHMLLRCDVSIEEEVHAFFNAMHGSGKRADILIANAGITSIKLFRDNTNEEIKRVMDINFMGAVYPVREAYDDVVSAKGSFIAISSVAGFAPLIGRTAYTASKHAVLGFFETLRTELSGTGAHVLVVCPGYIATNLRDHVYKEGEDNERTGHVVGGNATPDAVARQILRATVKRKTMLVTGIGRLSYFMKRAAPSLYERLMIRKLKGGFEDV